MSARAPPATSSTTTKIIAGVRIATSLSPRAPCRSDQTGSYRIDRQQGGCVRRSDSPTGHLTRRMTNDRRLSTVRNYRKNRVPAVIRSQNAFDNRTPPRLRGLVLARMSAPRKGPTPDKSRSSAVARSWDLVRWLPAQIATLDPGCFALVMATGIISNAFFFADVRRRSDAL